MADNPKEKGRDRELVSEQAHEVAYRMKTPKVNSRKRSRRSEKSGPHREKTMAYLGKTLAQPGSPTGRRRLAVLEALSVQGALSN